MRHWTLRLGLIASLAAAPLAAAAAVPGEAEADYLEWLSSTIEDGEWKLASFGPGAAIYTRAAEATKIPRMWVRLELQRPAFPSGTLSMTQLLEFDCPGRRTRILEGVSYKQNNLLGDGARQDGFGGWAEVSPELALDRVVTVACAVDPVPSR